MFGAISRRLVTGGALLLTAFLAAAWYVRKNHMPALGTCDAFSPGLALGHTIGRIGCFTTRYCYGKETHH